MLPINIKNDKTQYWFISESKKRTYILITEEIKQKGIRKKEKMIKTKIIDWKIFPLIGWWI